MIRVGDYIVTPEDEASVIEVLRSNRLSEGRCVREFEEKWADFCGTKYCVLFNSGTSALIAALEVLKYYKNNRRVLTTPLTFIATINAIVLSGYTPVFADVNPHTFVFDPVAMDQIAPKRFTSDTLVESRKLQIQNDADIFMPVHLYGYPVDMDNCTFQYKYMIEDACEAHGTLYKGRRAGSIGLMGVFSFYIAHNIQVGDMGAITTNSLDVYKSLKKIKSHGRVCECPVCGRAEGKCPHKDSSFDPRFTHSVIAYNFKTTEIQAALGLNQLKHADEILRKRQENVKYLNDGLAGVSQLQLPVHDPEVSYLAYPVILTDPEIDRNAFCKALEAAGVENRPFFSCVPTQQPAYSFMAEKWAGKLPVAERLGARGFHVGCHQYLEKPQLDMIISSIRKVLNDL